MGDGDDFGKLVLELGKILELGVNDEVVLLELVLEVDVGADFLPSLPYELEGR